MTLTIDQLFGLAEALQKLIRVDFPVQLAYHLSRAVDKVNTELRPASDVRVRTALVFGMQDKTGRIEILDFAGYQAEIKPLLEATVDLPLEPFLPIGTLIDKVLDMSAADIMSLGPLLLDNLT